jgi:two-component system sensor kinase FixL
MVIMDQLAGEDYFRSILDTVPDGLIVIDEQGLIISVSAIAEQMFGFTAADLVGENINKLMSSPDREQHDKCLSRYLATGQRHIIGKGRITSAKRQDGTTFPVNLSVGEAYIGGVRVFTGFIRDLTRNQSHEMQLHELQGELAHMSRVTAMGTLATSIAHELNQPLTAIANYVETVSMLLAEPEQGQLSMIREALDDCGQQAVRAGQIVRRLRDFISRGETDRMIIGLGRVISEASALALLGPNYSLLDFTVELAPGEAYVLVDRIQIEQVFVNLIRNAVDAMETTPLRRLAITCQRRDDMLLVSVEDSGPGFAVGAEEQLFQPFFSTKTSGMGVGLSICRSIIEAHGGKIWSEPSTMGGAALKFTLPEVTDD